MRAKSLPDNGRDRSRPSTSAPSGAFSARISKSWPASMTLEGGALCWRETVAWAIAVVMAALDSGEACAAANAAYKPAM
ncbi:hypothetical protein D3C81_1564330 [compost metagenome]